MAGLVAGTLLGSALQSWLRVDIIPVFVRPMPFCLCLLETYQCAVCSGMVKIALKVVLSKLGCSLQGLGSPGVFVSEWAILSLWAVGAFLA